MCFYYAWALFPSASPYPSFHIAKRFEVATTSRFYLQKCFGAPGPIFLTFVSIVLLIALLLVVHDLDVYFCVVSMTQRALAKSKLTAHVKIGPPVLVIIIIITTIMIIITSAIVSLLVYYHCYD